MHYSFHARKYKKYKDAEAAFVRINECMRELMPNAFMSVSPLDPKGHAVLIGCHDEDADFMQAIEGLWSDGKPVQIEMSVWMSLEAHHSRTLSEYVENGETEDLMIVTQNLILKDDGNVGG